MNFKKLAIVLVVFAFLASAISSYYFFQNRFNSNDQTAVQRKLSNSEAQQPEMTPFPFQELTIPYLRSRSYQSELSDLDQLSSSSQYTSYLTSYESDGLQINGLLTIPNDSKPEAGYPAVIFVHGYIPPAQYSTTDNYEAYVDFLARQGLVVFKIDLRGHANSEGTASGAYFSGDYIIDVLNAFAALENADFVDDSRIGLWGHSMAGNVVLRSAAAKQSIPKVVIWAGAVFTYEDFYDLRISDSSYQRPAENSERRRERDLLLETHGEFSVKSEFWQMVPATNYLDGLSTQFQIHHAQNDSVVDIEYSRGLVEIFESEKIPYEYFEYSTGGHNISGSVFSTAMQRATDFFLEN